MLHNYDLHPQLIGRQRRTLTSDDAFNRTAPPHRQPSTILVIMKTFLSVTTFFRYIPIVSYCLALLHTFSLFFILFLFSIFNFNPAANISSVRPENHKLYTVNYSLYLSVVVFASSSEKKSIEMIFHQLSLSLHIRASGRLSNALSLLLINKPRRQSFLLFFFGSLFSADFRTATSTMRKYIV